jgi:hypothetical protein
VRSQRYNNVSGSPQARLDRVSDEPRPAALLMGGRVRDHVWRIDEVGVLFE